MKNCRGCIWLDTKRPPNSLGYCMNDDTGIDPMYRARYESTERCALYISREKEVVDDGR